MQTTAFSEAMADLGMGTADLGRLLGANARTAQRWKSGEVRMSEGHRALLWALLHHDRTLIKALAEDYAPSEREMPEWLDRFLWALTRDRRLAAVLLDEWLPEDGQATPLLEGLLLAVLDRPARAVEMRAAR
ncbi:hypothetical protein [Roseicella sp. DB1501]|uniref:hypothetical protein n=1 Tax=Roseicella sp. DB1501 TaxID=2730925 RepID=UPI001491298C|nr:hypothetical protein [Roseicella sp. DB1501]NOG74228.1 hypothetical protein [Roseicella sp. DB1501]